MATLLTSINGGANNQVDTSVDTVWYEVDPDHIYYCATAAPQQGLFSLRSNITSKRNSIEYLLK